MSLQNDVLVLIRSVGERTESLCKKLILQQGIPDDQIIVVREVPFSASLKKSFQVGLEKAFKWTLCVDADVLLGGQSIKNLLHFANLQADHIFEVQGYVIDKFVGGPRMAGNHLYRTALLPKALQLWEHCAENIRPEATLLKSMANEGHPYVIAREIIGLHDYEQYYEDIFRKAFLQAHKHLHLAPLFVKFWREEAKRDPDFQCALEGFANGIRTTAEVKADKNAAIVAESFSKTSFQEKSKDVALDPEVVTTVIKDWTPNPDYNAFAKAFETKFFLKELDKSSSNGGLKQKIKHWLKRALS